MPVVSLQGFVDYLVRDISARVDGKNCRATGGRKMVVEKMEATLPGYAQRH